MAYSIPAPPASGVVVDPDGIQWRRDANGNWSATCQTCHTPLSPMSWPNLLATKVTLEDAPAPLAGEPV